MLRSYNCPCKMPWKLLCCLRIFQDGSWNMRLFFFFTSRIDQGNTIQDHTWLYEHRPSLMTWACLRVAGPRPLTVVFLSHLLVNRLSARLGRPSVPDVLAAHIHPGAPPAPAGLLLVSRLCWLWGPLLGLGDALPLQFKQAWSAYLRVCMWMRPLKPAMEISSKY